jgi:cytochrome c553
MPSPVRLIAAALLVLTLLAGAAAAAVYGISEWRLRRHYDAPIVPLRAAGAPDLVEGERMARIVGCLSGCHGPEGEGGQEHIEGIVRHTAPTLSDVLPRYSDAELARLIRYGLKQDGTSALGMISYTFWALGDQDLANIIAHLRSRPSHPPVPRELDLAWRGRLALVIGAWQVSVDQVDRTRPRWGDQPQQTPYERGRYLASITCSECHGLDFQGNPLERAPSLAVIGIYSPQQFHLLMRTAQPVGGRELDPNMSWVADAPFTDAEVTGLYVFLRTHHGFSP